MYNRNNVWLMVGVMSVLGKLDVIAAIRAESVHSEFADKALTVSVVAKNGDTYSQEVWYE